MSLEEIKDYLGVNGNENDELVSGLKEAAHAYLCGSIDPNYNQEDPRAKTLTKIIIHDLYNNRGMHNDAKLSANIRRLVDDFSLQLRLEA